MIRKSVDTCVGFNQSLIQRGQEKSLRPVIFKEVLSTWTAIDKWTPEYFDHQYSDVVVNAYENLPENTVPFELEATDKLIKISISELVKKIQQGNMCSASLAQRDIESLTTLNSDYNFSDFIPNTEHSKPVKVRLWLSRSTYTGLHFDDQDNFLTQIYGSKKVLLIAPSDSKNIYPVLDTFMISQVDPLKVDTNKFPKFDLLTAYEGTLAPGDMLFIPKGWWHHIYTDESSISLNCWYGDALSFMYGVKQVCCGDPRGIAVFLKDFIWHGILRRPSKGRLFIGSPSGEDAFCLLAKQVGIKVKN